jgi:hypothetical protein
MMDFENRSGAYVRVRGAPEAQEAIILQAGIT